MQNLEEEEMTHPNAPYGGVWRTGYISPPGKWRRCYLKVGGHCIVEVGAGQAAQVAELFTEQDFEPAELSRIMPIRNDMFTFQKEGVDCERYEAGETHRHVRG